MEGFTLSLALVDAVPVLCFGAGMILVATRFQSPVFIAGAVLSTLAGCMKVAWKLILGLRKKNVSWLNRPFVPMQATGFLLIFLSLILGFSRISWGGILAAVTGFPAVLCFLCWIAMMVTMVWYKKTRFVSSNARSNWTAQIVNCIGQLSLLLGILLAK